MAKRPKIPQYSKIYLTGPINFDTLNRFNQDLDSACKAGDDATILEITSGGGELTASLAIYNRIKASKIPVLTIANSFVGSAAVPIFLAGEKRLIRPNTTVLIHSLQTAFEGTTKYLSSETRQLQKEHLHYASLIVSHTGLDLKSVLKLMKTESYRDATWAIENKLADDWILND